jgi:ATP/maltotriose-dependent transcriptional regulator MalT
VHSAEIRRIPLSSSRTVAVDLRARQAFTARQHQVAALIAAGRSNNEVASELGISGATAKKHADALRYKLGVARRRQIPLAYREATGIDPLYERPEPT